MLPPAARRHNRLRRRTRTNRAISFTQRSVLTNIGFQRWFPAEQVFVEEEEEDSATLKALRHAQASLDGEHRGAALAGATPRSDALYYLV
ncbi:hypothetical protein [Mycobacterium sp.]|uniref:hypothetical protein n=1 Tax=Mycobacterium sp. TaxID=1785 RepID=UPI0028B2831E|nr:hypothetical protein [Mycobacterium sp.]MDT5055447.1 hypothetical protein [Mycobacterium sp.]